MVWGVMGIINLAHGAYIMIGAYISWLCYLHLGIDPFLSIPISMIVLFIIGYIVQAYLLNPILKIGLLLSLALTFGLDLIITDLFVLLFSSDLRSVKTSYSTLSLEFGPILVPVVRLAACFLAVALAFLFHAFLSKSRHGQAILATALDRDTAKVVGINPILTYSLTGAAGAALAGAAGNLASMIFPISPHMGLSFIGVVFVVTILGGIGSLGGAILGGFLFGLIQSFASALFGSNTQQIIAFTVFMVILVVKPQGLFGRKFFGENA